MREFWKKLGMFLLPMALLVVGVNITVDPGSLYRSTYEEAIAARLLAGQSVSLIRNIDDRRLNRLLAQTREEPARLMVLGSSQSLELTSGNFCVSPGEFWNVSLTGASIYDYLAVIGVLAQNGQLPERLLIEVTPRLAAGQPENARWQTLRPEYNALLQQFKIRQLPVSLRQSRLIDQVRALFSFSYFQASIEIYRRGGMNTETWYLWQPNRPLRTPEGAQFYNPVQMPAPDDVEVYVNNHLRIFPTFEPMNPQVLAALSSLIAQLEAWDIEVALFLPPLHPEVYNTQAAAAPDVLADYTRWLDTLSAENVISHRLGGHDPSGNNLSTADFRDGVHLIRPAIDRYFTSLGCEWTANP